MIDGTSTELPIELLGPQATQVLDGKGPEVEYIVAWEGISLLKKDHLGPQEAQFDGRPQAAWPRTNDQALWASQADERTDGNMGGFESS